MPIVDYGKGARTLQERFETRRLADRVAESAARAEFTDSDRQFIESQPFFFMATTGVDGMPQCSFKGGRPGFVRVTGPSELAFPSFDGNGMYLSLGNVADTGKVGLLFINFEQPRRLRINGVAEILHQHPLIDRVKSAQSLVRISATQIINNCQRHIPKMKLEAYSRFTPETDTDDIGHDWQQWPEWYDVLPERLKPWEK